jgi:hypothetical protein
MMWMRRWSGWRRRPLSGLGSAAWLFWMVWARAMVFVCLLVV